MPKWVFSLLLSLMAKPGNDQNDMSVWPKHLVSHGENGLLVINEDVLEDLRSIGENGREIAVVSIVGPWRSGKSYLLNELISPGRATTFGIGHTTNPKTEGMDFYLHSSPEDSRDILFLDTAGLFCPYNTEQGDARLMVLASLLSSIVIYNHHHVLNEQEIERFKFIIELAQTVPSSLDREASFLDFQPHLVWVMRDFFLDIKDREENDVNATKLVQQALENTDNQDIYKFFRSIQAVALPHPTKDTSQVKNLATRPELRSLSWKKEVASLRRIVFRLAQPKRLQTDKPPMGGKELRDLLITFVRRLNSDKGIDSLNTMEAIVLAINEQKISDSFEIFESSFLTIELPHPPVDLFSSFQEAKGKALDSLRESLSSYEDHKLEENLQILDNRMEESYKHCRDRNLVQIQDLVTDVKLSEARYYKEGWNGVKLPMDMSVMKSYDKKLRQKAQASLEKQLRIYITREDDFNGIMDNLIGAFSTSFNEQVTKNENMSERMCSTVKEVWTDRLREKIRDSYLVLSDLTDDFERVDIDYQEKCKGPSKNYFHVDKIGLMDDLRRKLNQLLEVYQSRFFVVCVVQGVLFIIWACGGIPTQVFTTVTAAVTLVFAFFYGTNPLLKERVDIWFFVDAIMINSGNMVFLSCGLVLLLISSIFNQILHFGSSLSAFVVSNPEVLVILMGVMVCLLAIGFIKRLQKP